MYPIISDDVARDDFVKKELRDNNIVCHLDLKSTVGSKSTFIYSSIDDPEVGHILKARIMLDHQPISKGMILD